MLSKRSVVIGLILGFIIGLPTGYLLVQVISNMGDKQQTNGQEPIFCSAAESGTSYWRKREGYPVLSSYYAGAENFSSLPNVNLGVRINNNHLIPLFNVKVEVEYRTIENEWNTTEKVYLGFFDIQQNKETKITLSNPYLSLWQTKRPVYYDPDTDWENVAVYVLNATDLKIRAYGYAKP